MLEHPEVKRPSQRITAPVDAESPPSPPRPRAKTRTVLGMAPPPTAAAAVTDEHPIIESIEPLPEDEPAAGSRDDEVIELTRPITAPVAAQRALDDAVDADGLSALEQELESRPTAPRPATSTAEVDAVDVLEVEDDDELAPGVMVVGPPPATHRRPGKKRSGRDS
jgi:hypothetical protein